MNNLTNSSSAKTSDIYNFAKIFVISAALYSLGLYYSLVLSPMNESFSIFFLPAGIAAGLAITFGYRIPLIIVLTKLVFTYLVATEVGFLALFLSAISSGIEAFTALYIYRAFINRSKSTYSHNVTLLIAIFAPIVSALIGVWNKSYVNELIIESYFLNFYTFYSGDVLAILVILPLFLNFKDKKEVKVLDYISPFLALLLVYAFNFKFSSPYSVFILCAIFIPALFGTNFGLYFTVIMVSSFLNWSAIDKLGLYTDVFVQSGFLRVQIFILAIALFSLGISDLKKSRLFKISYKPLLLMWFFIGLIFFFNYKSNHSSSDLYINQKVRNIKLLLTEKINILKLITLSTEALVNSSRLVTKEEWSSFEKTFNSNSEFQMIKIQAMSLYDAQGKAKNFVSVNDPNISEVKIHQLLEMNFFEQYYYKSVNYSQIFISPLYETYGNDGKKYDIVFLIKANKVGEQLKSLSIIGFDVDLFFTSVIDQHFEQLDIDIYELNNSLPDKLIFSQRTPYSQDELLEDNPYSVNTHLKILNATYRIQWNDTFRLLFNHENVNPIIILIGSLITFVFSTFLMSKKFYSLKNDTQNKVLKYKVVENKQKFDLLFESTDDAVIIFSLDSIIDANQAALDLFEFKNLDELIALNPADILQLRQTTDLKDDNFFNKKILEVNLNQSINFNGFVLTKNTPVYSSIHIGQIHMNDKFLYMMVLSRISEHKSLNVTTKIINVSQGNLKNNLNSLGPQASSLSPSPIGSTSLEKSSDLIFNNQEVLLVDDNEVNIMMSKKYLERWGLRVDVAENGKIAVAMAIAKNYSLILMDIHMPVMDGYEATRIIRQSNKHVPIIALSADVLNNLSEANYFVKFTDFIPKPFRVDDFLNKMKEYIK